MATKLSPLSQTNLDRFRVEATEIVLESDPIGIEEPLQINLVIGDVSTEFSVTMRTPGEDKALIYGLIFNEGIIRRADDVIQFNRLSSDDGEQDNLREVVLAPQISLDLPKITRRHTTYSGCGLCGKTSIQALELKQSRPMKPIPVTFSTSTVQRLRSLLSEQPLFSNTGGVHVAGFVPEIEGLLDFGGAIFFEDVGRHNALDKLIGCQLIENDLQKNGCLLLSGRISFELVQKAVMAGYSTIVALGAPSSLAIKTANQFDVMLMGFAKNNRFNLYTSHKQYIEVE